MTPRALASGDAAESPAAPPLAPPPAASAHYLRPSSERQLQPGQLAGLYELRGPRVTNQARKRLTAAQVSCIETYERLAGVPFCVNDLAQLDRALTLTSLVNVLRSIRDCSRWPDENPGNYIVRDGMKHVANYIEKNKVMHAKARGSKKRAGGSALSPEVAQKIKDRKRARHERTGSPKVEPVSPKAPTVSSETEPVSSSTAIVSDSAKGSAPEPVKKGTVWPS